MQIASHDAGQVQRVRTPDGLNLSVRVPTLVTHGRLDRLVLPKAAEMTAAAVPGARLSWFDDCGHSPFYEDAPRYNRELDRFVSEAWVRS